MTVPRIRILALAAKVQSAKDVDSVPTLAANAIILNGIPGLQLNYLEDGNRDAELHGGFGSIGSDGVIGRWGQIDVTLNLRGAGTAYSASNLPECHPFLLGAGLQHTVDATEDAEKVTYTDTDDASLFKYFSMYLWSAQKLFKMINCVAVPKVGADAGKRAGLTVTVVGIITDISQATITSTTYSQVPAPKFVAGEISIGAFDKTSTPGLVCQRVMLDLGIQQVLSPGAGSDQGIDAFEITDSQHMLEMDIQVAPLATWNPFAIGEEGTGAGSTDRKVEFQFGGTQYNRVKFATGQWGFRPVAPTDNAGLAIYKLSGKIAAKTAANGRSTLITFD
jgi:hypothetical protein